MCTKLHSIQIKSDHVDGFSALVYFQLCPWEGFAHKIDFRHSKQKVRGWTISVPWPISDCVVIRAQSKKYGLLKLPVLGVNLTNIFFLAYHKNCLMVATHFTALTSPSEPFTWSLVCQHKFQNLKGLLSCSPVLSAPNISLLFDLEIDAWAFGVAAILLQENKDGIDLPVIYFWRNFIHHQIDILPLRRTHLNCLETFSVFEVLL